MNTPVLYSTNPWLAHEISMRYRNGIHFVWCSDFFDPKTAPTTSAAARIAPSSSPKGIYDSLYDDYFNEDNHSALIKGYKKTFSRLARDWLSEKTLTKEAHDEIISVVKSNSWKIWRPVLYVIPREQLDKAGRVKSVVRANRASYGPELQILDLHRNEFDLIEIKP